MNASGQPLDLRVRRTYKFLWAALLDLMLERGFEAITVTDICERAMVHRTTFYKHFEDKFGLLFYGIRDQLNALFEEVDAQIDKSEGVKHSSDVLPHLTVLFEHVLRQQRFYHLMLCGDGISKFYTLFRQSLTERFISLSQGHTASAPGNAVMRNELRAQIHVAALLTTLTWWLEHHCPYSPQEMANYLWEDAFSKTPIGWHIRHAG